MKILKKILPCFIIIILGILIYSNSFDNSFHFDDEGFIASNDDIKYSESFSDLWENLNTATFQIRIIPFYTFNLNHRIHELNVFGFHVVNVAIHVINALLIFWLFSQILSLNRFSKELIYKYRWWVALFGALIFLTHPIATQAVTYICQRFAAMATMFYLLSMNLYVFGRKKDSVLWKRILCFLGVCLFAILGMFTKQNVFTLPFMILLTEFILLSSDGPDGRKSSLKKYWPWALVILMFSLVLPIYFMMRGTRIFGTLESQSFQGDIITSPVYLMTQFRVIWVYLRLLFIPLGQNLDYHFPVSTSFFEWKTFVGCFGLMGILGYGISQIRKRPLIAYGIIWFFVTLTVEASIIPIRNVIFEHRVYLPSVGFCLFAVVGLFELIKKPRHLKTCLIVIILLLSILTFRRNGVWHDEITLWTDVVKKSPNKSRGYLNIGNAYFSKKDYQKAVKAYARSIELDPGYYRGYNNRAVVYLMTAQYELAHKDYNKAIELNEDYAEAYANRGIVYQKLGNLDMAIADYTKAIELKPKYSNVYSNRAHLYKRKGLEQKAFDDYTKALDINPHDAVTYNNRGNAYLNKKTYDKALKDFEKAIEVDSEYADAYYNRGLVYKRTKLYSQAIESFTKAIALKTPFGLAMSQRGDVYVFMKEYDLAYKDYTAALTLQPQSPTIHYNRSVVSYYIKDYPQALKDAQAAQKFGYSVPEKYIEELKGLISQEIKEE